MILFVTVIIKLYFVSVVCSNNLIGNSKGVENSSIYRNENLTGFIFTVKNSSSFMDSRIDLKSNQVDCFGLGKTLATVMEWFFLNNPNGTNALNVKLLLSSRKQPQRVQVIIGKQFGLEWTDFQIERRTIVIVHGFLSHGQQSWISDMEKAFLQWGDVNVVIVDWSSAGNTWNYYKAAVNTRVVGYQIARFLEHAENATTGESNSSGNRWGPLHLVGHSLGAHICGFTAKELKRRRSAWKVERITGLDPAQPCFKNADFAVKLHKSDAPFVDIIHTNGRLLSEIGLGLPEPIGHVDFYPNGGRSQPGCVRTDSSYFEYLPLPLQGKKIGIGCVRFLKNSKLILAIDKSICSHGRSYVYLTESLVSDVKRNCTFWAHHWDLTYRNLMRIAVESCDKNSCTEMGINAINYPQRGTFFIATSDSVPFCVNGTRLLDEVITELQKDHADELDD